MKTYMIVTNDKYETPVKMDLVGAKSVAEYLGLSVSRVNKCICTGVWNHKAELKAIVDDSVVVDSVKRAKEYGRQYRMTHDRSEYMRQYYQRKKETFHQRYLERELRKIAEGEDAMGNNKANMHGERTRQKILEVIIQYIEKHGYPPSIREICEGTGIKSPSTVNGHLQKMLRSGMLETDAEKEGVPRAIRVPGYKFVKVEEKVEQDTLF